jgi:CRP-like cAMP-binding protein
VRRDGVVLKTYTNNDYFGETSMILNMPRNADVVAESELKVLAMDKYDFLYFIRGSEIARHMKVIAENREYDTWLLFDEAPLLHGLSATQRTQLQGIMTRVEFADEKIIAKEGAERDTIYLVDSGTVAMSRCGRRVARARRGSLFMRIYSPPARGRHRFTLTAAGPVVAYTIDTMEFYRFLERNPGVFLLLREAKIRAQIVVDERNGRP